MSFVITNTAPGNNASSIDVNALIHIEFNAELLVAKSNAFAITDNSDGSAIAFSVSKDTAAVTLTPDTVFRDNTSYTVIVKSDYVNLLNTNGETLDSNYSFVFSTGITTNEDTPETVDGTPPRLINSNPKDTEVNVISDSITLTFNEQLPQDLQVELKPNIQTVFGYKYKSPDYFTADLDVTIEGATVSIKSATSLTPDQISALVDPYTPTLVSDGVMLGLKSDPPALFLRAGTIYTLRVFLQDATLIADIAFSTRPQLLFNSIDNLKRAIGPSFANNFSEFELLLTLAEESKYAYKLWNDNNTPFVGDAIPESVAVLTILRAKRSLITTDLSDVRSLAESTRRLGDFTITRKTNIKLLTSELNDLTKRINDLEDQIRNSNKPLSGIGYIQSPYAYDGGLLTGHIRSRLLTKY